MLFYVYNFFIVLLLLLCHGSYCDVCKCLHGLGICVSFYPSKLMLMMMMIVVLYCRRNALLYLISTSE